MKRFVCSLLFLLGPLLAHVDALDLTPHPLSTAYNSLRANRYFFDDAGKSMGFRIDNNMTVKGTSSSVAFKFNDLRNADMQIKKSPRKPETQFVGEDLEGYRKDGRAALPEGVTDVQLEREIAAAIPINGWTSYQFVFSYKLLGVNYHRSVTFLNYNKLEQLVIDVGAPDAAFELVSLRGYQVLNSLSELQTESAGST